MSQERDLSKTGASEGSGMKYVKIDAKARKFVTPGGVSAGELIFFLDGAHMEFRQADPANDLPPRWHLNLACAANIDGGPMDFALSLSSHWENPVFGKMVNAILGAMDKSVWPSPNDRLIRVILKEKTSEGGGRSYIDCMVFRSTAPKDFMPLRHEWDSSVNRYAGVPEDRDEEKALWLKYAAEIVKALNGTITGVEEATIKIPGVTKSTTGSNSTATTPNTASATPSEPTNAPDKKTAKDFKDRFVNAIVSISGNDGSDIAIKANDLIDKTAASKTSIGAGYNKQKLVSDAISALNQGLYGPGFMAQGDKIVFVSSQPDQDDLKPGEDDLPF